MEENNKTFLSNLGRDLFLGFIAFVPLALFVALFYYLLIFIESIGEWIFGFTKARETAAAISACLVLIILYVGRKIRRHEKSILSMIEQFIITKIPVIGGWYITFRDILQTFTAGSGEKNYLGTARVPVGFGYMIGFVTKREAMPDGTSQVTVFVPTSPNPTTGLVLFFPEALIEYLDMTPETAFKKIISLGVK